MPASTPVPVPNFREEAAANLSEILWWFTQPRQEAEGDAVETLIDLWLVDIGLAGQIARLPWVSDGIEPFELKAMRGLLTTAKVDQALTHRMLRFSWIFAQLTEEEEDAIGSIASIASRGHRVGQGGGEPVLGFRRGEGGGERYIGRF